ncbi:MAG: hypothetical protein Q9224_004233 [Gallowayella concinna]
MDEFWIDPKFVEPSEEWKQLNEKIAPIRWFFTWRPQQGRFEEALSAIRPNPSHPNRRGVPRIARSRTTASEQDEEGVPVRMIMTRATASTLNSKFPTNSEPKVWLLSSGASPIGIALSRQLLAHGDFVVFGTQSNDTSDNASPRSADFAAFWIGEVLVREGWKDRARAVGLDRRCETQRIPIDDERKHRNKGQCQAAVAEVVTHFRKLDVLFCCASQAIIGTVEELGASSRTSALVRDQFETNYFGHVNIIKAALPSMRAQDCGHIILLSGITGHLGTPGLGMYCASQWAIEGFCDSLAYEVAPFNIKMTIVQPNVEISILTNEITAAPQLPQYAPENNPAPLFREIVGGLLDRIDASTKATNGHTYGHSEMGRLSSESIVSVYPQLSERMKSQLLAETITALTAIGGHDNPPARHIVGHEAVASVKEKLKTVSEELEDFVETLVEARTVNFNKGKAMFLVSPAGRRNSELAVAAEWGHGDVVGAKYTGCEIANPFPRICVDAQALFRSTNSIMRNLSEVFD